MPAEQICTTMWLSLKPVYMTLIYNQLIQFILDACINHNDRYANTIFVTFWYKWVISTWFHSISICTCMSDNSDHNKTKKINSDCMILEKTNFQVDF